MPKKYNIGKSSDMNRFEKDLKKSLLNQVHQAVLEETYEVECPYCTKHFNAHQGKNVCPHCHKTVNLELNFKN